MEQQAPIVMTFGKYKGRDIRDVPLSYLRWWKSGLIESLRACSEEISRREALGINEAEELQLSTLPPHVRENLLRRLETCSNEDQRVAIHAIIQIKFQEYTPKHRASEYREWNHDGEEREGILYEDDTDP